MLTPYCDQNGFKKNENDEHETKQTKERTNKQANKQKEGWTEEQTNVQMDDT